MNVRIVEGPPIEGDEWRRLLARLYAERCESRAEEAAIWFAVEVAEGIAAASVFDAREALGALRRAGGRVGAFVVFRLAARTYRWIGRDDPRRTTWDPPGGPDA